MSKKKKKKNRRLIVLILLLLLLAFGGWITYRYNIYLKSKFARYPEFGILMPEAYPIHGIDVSRYQEIVAWEEVKAMKAKNIQLGFVFIKATEGVGNSDSFFPRNWRRSKRNGMVRGAYHFFIASKDGKMQAENFINTVDLQKGDLPPVLDVEQMNGTSASIVKKEVKEWLTVVEDYYNVKPIIYTNIDFYNRYLGKEFDEYPFWVAHYYQQAQPRIDRDWSFWQHNDNGNVNGIRSKVDFNVFSGDSLQFKELLIQ